MTKDVSEKNSEATKLNTPTLNNEDTASPYSSITASKKHASLSLISEKTVNEFDLKDVTFKTISTDKPKYVNNDN